MILPENFMNGESDFRYIPDTFWQSLKNTFQSRGDICDGVRKDYKGHNGAKLLDFTND